MKHAAVIAYRKLILMVVAVVLVAACATTANLAIRVTAGRALAETIAEGTQTLLAAKKITPADAQRVHDALAIALGLLDGVEAMGNADITAAEKRLDAAETLLTPLVESVAKKQGASL